MTDPIHSPDYNNWVTLGVGSTFVTGDKAQFQREQNTKAGVFGGVQDFHWQEFVGKNGQITMDGHAHGRATTIMTSTSILQTPNWAMSAPVTRSFAHGMTATADITRRTTSHSPAYDNNLYWIAAAAWIEAGLTLPDLPVFSLRYEYDSRVGLMDSTSWG